jgi:RimJ/RimL family protein N-acetyltransferase
VTTAISSSSLAAVNWRAELPTLTARHVALREPTLHDTGDLLALLSLEAGTRFGVDQPVRASGIQQFIERASRDRALGLSFTYAITLAGSRRIVGLFQTRQMDPLFETAEWECVILPAFRGSGAFMEAARLVGSFAFGTVGAHRLEARVATANGRGNGALRKLGAVQEGVLRRAERRGGAYLNQVLWSILKEDWGEHWVSTGPRVH